jgi:DNA-directed RNA polymerase subunit RPC12/RpoP
MIAMRERRTLSEMAAGGAGAKQCPKCGCCDMRAVKVSGSQNGSASVTWECKRCHEGRATTQEDVGFVCPKCGGRAFPAVYTRSQIEGTVNRQRICKNPECQHKINTTEKVTNYGE